MNKAAIFLGASWVGLSGLGITIAGIVASGWAAYWLDGLLIGNVAAVAYFATFLFQHYRQRP